MESSQHNSPAPPFPTTENRERFKSCVLRITPSYRKRLDAELGHETQPTDGKGRNVHTMSGRAT